MQCLPGRGPLVSAIIEERLAPLDEEAEVLALNKKHNEADLRRLNKKRLLVTQTNQIYLGNTGCFHNPVFNDSSCVIQLLRGIRQVVLNFVVQVTRALITFLF
jgi:hypothetical protein